jgi:uncharacterized protein YkwD
LLATPARGATEPGHAVQGRPGAVETAGMKPILAAVAVTLLTAVSAVPAQASYDHLLAPTTTCANQTDRSQPAATQMGAMRCMANYARITAGVPGALAASGLFTMTADAKAGDLLRCGEFSHTACGRPVTYWMTRGGYTTGCYGVGENIAWGSGSRGTVREIMRSWLNSTGHRNNLLDPRFKEQGVALRTGTFQGYAGAAVWVHHFGYRC